MITPAPRNPLPPTMPWMTQLVDPGSPSSAPVSVSREAPRATSACIRTPVGLPYMTALLARLEAIPREHLVLVTHLPPFGILAARDRKFDDRTRSSPR